MTFPRSHRRQSAARCSRTSGFTLVEMLLVLAVLGIIAAITWPGLHRAWMDHKIKEATEMVRTQLAGTRNRAIDAILIYEFRYELDGNRFLVLPHEPSEMLGEETNPFGQAEIGASDGLFRIGGELRPGIKFASTSSDLTDLGIPVIEESVPVADWQLAGLPNIEELKQAKWSVPMLFFPDGSAEQSVLRLEDEFGQQVEVSVRGLTGAVSATPLRKESGL